MNTFNIRFQDKLVMTLNEDNNPIQIDCCLPVLGEGNNRIVYDMGDYILKVAKSAIASMYNQNEIRLWNYLRESSSKIKFNRIIDADENGYWYVAEKANTGGDAMKNALKYIEWLDYSDNAGYDRNGKLTIVDAENVYVKDIEYLLQKRII
ncbi:hypothetical protein DS742_14250 [Lacrimispora amygdalina]|uniref:Uncharacterized protein n=1 Tax=Lacrimispora amygdalina TaxID=253257 RepID=A0A3E2NBK8_9FIRM|nr:hypothetical protein [Clostridium indicum]RFZ78271.1 hypothetical protein DS742_14250 [Clostridium indicum]